MSITRRPKWHPPPPPTPRILHLPRRPRRKPKTHSNNNNNNRGNLALPILLLNSGDSSPDERRQRVLEDFEYGNVEDSWRFQAEILRAECNFLRMERDLAVKKLDLNQIQTNKLLKCSTKNMTREFEENLKDLGRIARENGVKCSNFDQKASILRRRLDKLSVSEIKTTSSFKFDHQSSSLDSNSEQRFTDVENLRRKMERLSKGMLERMEEEYGSMLLSSRTSSASASSSKRIEYPNLSSSLALVPQNHPQASLILHESKSREEKACSGRCKAIVRKIVEQVRAEMEQWSQMQEMVGLVREEMEELRASRDFWENKALASNDSVQSLQLSVQEWRDKTLSYETKVNELQQQITDFQFEVKALRTKTYSQQQIPRESSKEKEKRVLICSLKENHGHRTSSSSRGNQSRRRGDGSAVGGLNKIPLREISNSFSPSSPLYRQNNRAVTLLHCRENYNPDLENI
ncbi:hypothetical protein GIB67_018209 [Kingdonia uniflora]|uniref:Uncharacterized protein n=1 Tax=Kingdonia uniflora TaxID=39325 RepID=A0A7J7NMF6_9MAGN|nr:hypothetical protein GIB67_018209 [Kingdonia uniflora]